MTRGTTSTFTLTIDNDSVDLTAASVRHVYVTIFQGRALVTKSDDDLDIEKRAVGCYLSQEETLRFQSDKTPAEVQINWTYEDASGEIKRMATNIGQICIGRQLHGGRQNRRAI